MRHIASSWDGHRVAVRAFERRVAVWDVSGRKQISEFDPRLDFCGQRLGITSDGLRVIAGAYQRYGICCYDADASGLPTLGRSGDMFPL